MGTISTNSPVASALFGKVRTAVLALLFGHTDREFYLREIVRATGVGQGAVQRELARLVGAGLLTRERRGNLVLYRANSRSPLFAEMHMLMLKTAGAADVVGSALAPLSDRIAFAFLFGSVAQGREVEGSDIDLMVVGEADFGEVVAALWVVQKTLRREINPCVYSPEEWSRRISAGDHFVTSVLKAPRIPVMGEEDELSRLAA